MAPNNDMTAPWPKLRGAQGMKQHHPAVLSHRACAVPPAECRYGADISPHPAVARHILPGRNWPPRSADPRAAKSVNAKKTKVFGAFFKKEQAKESLLFEKRSKNF
jgi:hypothetical protein